LAFVIDSCQLHVPQLITKLRWFLKQKKSPPNSCEYAVLFLEFLEFKQLNANMVAIVSKRQFFPVSKKQSIGSWKIISSNQQGHLLILLDLH